MGATTGQADYVRALLRRWSDNAGGKAPPAAPDPLPEPPAALAPRNEANEHECIACGRAFHHPGRPLKRIKYCSKSCCARAGRRRRLGRPPADADNPRPTHCATCDRRLPPPQQYGQPRRYCCYTCAIRGGRRERLGVPVADRAHRPTRQCAKCGKEFQAARAGQRYCPGRQCSDVAYRRRMRGKPELDLPHQADRRCWVCGADINQLHGCAKTCGPACAGLLAKARRHGLDVDPPA